MSATNATNAMSLSVETDRELEEGVFQIGARYCVMTPTFFYLGILAAVTGSVLVLTDVYTVSSTGGDLDAFFAGRAGDVKKHPSPSRTIIDRGGSVLHLMPERKK